ncbi:HepT-like ribonuclease domain-containing protein [Zhihengliuella halotolerans]|uniref:HepT-like ribonuclease domain-containing protein n=1 Tax=Zhihengliuella halotolerans TaxID=370736 RepID=UPI000C80498D|nr:HepT-like ribonuclease domain-containing protein [Zhihengliuella halotolerans]
MACLEVRWRSMKGMRNLVAHEYHAVDYSIIWQALAAELPAEAERVRDILRELDGE